MMINSSLLKRRRGYPGEGTGSIKDTATEQPRRFSDKGGGGGKSAATSQRGVGKWNR